VKGLVLDLYELNDSSAIQGDVVTERTHISLDGYSKIGTAVNDLKFACQVYCCDLDVAPTHKDDQGM
jgi:hypothetical protein